MLVDIITEKTKTWENKKIFPKPIELNEETINSWKKELNRFYGCELSEIDVLRGFYFSMGRMYSELNFYPFLNENGDIVDLKSTMKREILIESISMIKTGYIFPKNTENEYYEYLKKNGFIF